MIRETISGQYGPGDEVEGTLFVPLVDGRIAEIQPVDEDTLRVENIEPADS